MAGVATLAHPAFYGDPGGSTAARIRCGGLPANRRCAGRVRAAEVVRRLFDTHPDYVLDTVLAVRDRIHAALPNGTRAGAG